MTGSNTVIQKKICMLGDYSVGKTSLVRRYVEGKFDDHSLSTIGVKISRRIIQLSGQMPVNLLLWDLAGSEEFTGVQSNYLQGASGAFLVCDLTRIKTLAIIEVYARRIREISPRAALVIAGNKVDLEDQRQIADTELAKLAEELNAAWIVTSAKTGAGVEEAFAEMAERILGGK
jgi:small GTP-binding protein